MTIATDCQPGVDERVFAWRGVRLRYYACGAGAPLLLLHGSAASFGRLVPVVAQGRRLLLPDLPGHGGSAALPEGSSPAVVATLLSDVCSPQEGDEGDVL